MSEINRINVTGLKAYKCRFENEKDNFNSTTYANFKSSYINSCSDPKVNAMKNKLNGLYIKIQIGYNKIFNWWTHYLEDVEGIENTLSNDGRSGSINESLIRNYINSNLEELPDYFTDFTKFQIQTLGLLEFANSQNKLVGKTIELSAITGFFYRSLVGKITSDSDKLSSETGATVSNDTESIVEPLIMGDTSKDKNGWFEKSTIIDKEGTRVEFEKVENCEDGTVKYYKNKYSSEPFKEIKPDGTVLIFDRGDRNCIIYNPDGSYIDAYAGDNISREAMIIYYDKNGNKYKEELYEDFKSLDKLDSLDKLTIYATTIFEGDMEKTYIKDGTYVEKNGDNVVRYNAQGKITYAHEDGVTTYCDENGNIESITDHEKTTKYNEDGTISHVDYKYNSKSDIDEIEYIYTTDNIKYEYTKMKDGTCKLVEYGIDGTKIEKVGKSSGGMTADDNTTWIPLVKGTTTTYDEHGKIISIRENGLTTVMGENGSPKQYKYSQTEERLLETLSKYNIAEVHIPTGLGEATENYDDNNNLTSIVINNTGSGTCNGVDCSFEKTYIIYPDGTAEDIQIWYSKLDGQKLRETYYKRNEKGEILISNRKD